jgi:diphosphomevalonate decarboxylase
MERHMSGTGGMEMDRRLAAVRAAIGERSLRPAHATAEAYAPANIALVKYWGKRDEALRLPVTGSLSVSLGELGTRTRLTPADADRVALNGVALSADDPFARRLSGFLDLFRSAEAPGFAVETVNTVPTAAGLASSASGFAALVGALDALMGWSLPERGRSMLARLGSGSACRSVRAGFMEWRAGERADGADSFAEPLSETWPALRIGLVVVEAGPKPIGSGEAMRRTCATSPLYAAWPATVARDLTDARAAIAARDLERLGVTAEGNALAMHATMIAARPSVCYWTADTLDVLRRLRVLRGEGVAVYATMDAGPNVKLLFEHSAESAILGEFPGLAVVRPF